MGNPVYRTYAIATNGAQAPINLDWLNVSRTGIAVFNGGTTTYTVEGTLDDIVPVAEGGQAGASLTPRWFTLAEFPVLATSRFASIEMPWLWIRINFAAPTDGSVEFKVQQAVNNVFRG